MLLSDVCLSATYIRPNTRTEKPRKTKTGTEVATWTPLSRSLTEALTCQAAAAVSVGTYWACETTATLQCARRRYALTEGVEGRGHIVAAARLQLVQSKHTTTSTTAFRFCITSLFSGDNSRFGWIPRVRE